ncbi:MAG TPA: T9SS type A sorting domain-containing protein, partial [bacterium]
RWLQANNNETEGDTRLTSSTTGSFTLTSNLTQSQPADMQAVEIKAANSGCGGSVMNPLLPGSDTENGTAATPTSTPTPAPTSVVNDSSLQTVKAQPNVSRNGDPVNFHLNLRQPAKVQLMLFSLVGERVYQSSTEGSKGENVITWNLQSQAGFPIASGLYIYVVQAESGNGTEKYSGKIVVLH